MFQVTVERIEEEKHEKEETPVSAFLLAGYDTEEEAFFSQEMFNGEDMDKRGEDVSETLLGLTIVWISSIMTLLSNYMGGERAEAYFRTCVENFNFEKFKEGGD